MEEQIPSESADGECASTETFHSNASILTTFCLEKEKYYSITVFETAKRNILNFHYKMHFRLLFCFNINIFIYLIYLISINKVLAN